MIWMIVAVAFALVAVAAGLAFVRQWRHARELADRLRASTALAEEAIEGRYNVLEAVGGGMYILDAGDRFSLVNEEAERLMRVAPGELVGKALTEVIDPLGSDLLPEIRRARESGEPVSRVAYFAATGWWVENSDRMPPPRSGLMIIMCAVAGSASRMGLIWLKASIHFRAEAS